MVILDGIIYDYILKRSFICAVGFIFINSLFAWSFPAVYLGSILGFRSLWLIILKACFYLNPNIDSRIINEKLNWMSALYSQPLEVISQMYINTHKKYLKDNNIKTDKFYNILKDNINNIYGDISKLYKPNININNKIIKRIIMENLLLPTGLPWDLVGLKLFKFITFAIFNIEEKQKRSKLKILSNLLINKSKRKRLDEVKKYGPDLVKFGMNYIPNLDTSKGYIQKFTSSDSQVFSSPFNIYYYIIDLIT